MYLPLPRGPLSTALFAAMAGDDLVPSASVSLSEDDLQISLWVLYELHYRGFDDVAADREWDPALLQLRRDLEAVFEADVRELTAPLEREVAASDDDLVTQLEQITTHPGPSLAQYLQRSATTEEFAEYLSLRSLYHLKEADPHSWVLPRLAGRAKAALAEIQYDEYGGGVPSRLHQGLFAEALTGAGLDPTYGAYVDRTPAHVLAVNNLMSLLGLHRRLRGAAMGHLAAFEMTSPVPCRRILRGAERLGMGPEVVRYYDEHVEADAVHEHLASRSLCGALVDDEPELRADVLFGASACVLLDAVSAERTLADWAERGTALSPAAQPDAA